MAVEIDASLRGRQRKAAADKARLRGVELLLLLDERVCVGELASLRVARELLAPLLNEGVTKGLLEDKDKVHSNRGQTMQHGKNLECGEESTERTSRQKEIMNRSRKRVIMPNSAPVHSTCV